ncbi:hypothetical protein MMC31_004008 [Peltigera leucophlebia]|nr:hypothetical protein [Peltigera leucophlebia]
MTSNPLLIPVQLEAFVLNPAVCGTGKDGDNGARIIPITQPNYSFLRLDNFMIQSDVQNHADLHNTAPADINSRMTDLGAEPPAPRRNRHGVYLHWILPRAYRAGVSSSDSVPEERRKQDRLRQGLPAEDSTKPTSASYTPEYIQPPTRWIVIRKLDMDSIRPASAASSFKEYQAWVIESDYLWQLDEVPLDLDLQVDVAPFVVGLAGEESDIEQQAEVFIGRKTPLDKWTDDPKPNPPNISLLRSSNQLFADFQLHNSNVFSMLDNFQYGDSSHPQYLDGSRASYYLMGWHWKNEVDPLWNPGQDFTHAERLDALFMSLDNSAVPNVTNAWLQAKDPVRVFCHGAMYDVNWDHGKKPTHVPADDFASRLKEQKVPALSIGTTPMDSLKSYCTARSGSGEDPPSITKLEEDILAIDSLLHARDDGVEGQREAKDTVYNWNFARAQGGMHYFLGGEDSNGKPTQPDSDAITALKELNQYQLLLDACKRASTQYRWDMFSCWWTYVSDVSNKEDTRNNLEFKEQTRKISGCLNALQDRMTDLQQHIDGLLEPASQAQNILKNAKTGTLPFYYRGRDPTVLVGGIDSGWPSDYLDKVSVRLPVHIVPLPSTSTLPDALSALVNLMKNLLPDTLTLAAEALSSEFYALRPGGSQSGAAPAGKVYPQFHDEKANEQWRDQWGDRQPWFPLYAEWEVEYTHIPFKYWSLDEQAARLSENKLVRYGVKTPSDKPLYDELGAAETHDTRILSGRVLILPQPSFSLGAKVKQLFSDTPPEILDQYLTLEDRQTLLDGINQLSYLSSPLSGLTEGLLTLAQGTHIKPENKVVGPNGELIRAIKAAQFDDAGLTKENIELIASNSGLTPFAAMVKFPDKNHCPFKPVTHGQFRFRKFNVIDKFGQALVAISPQPLLTGPPPLYPCISDFYEPQMVEGTQTANTVIKDNDGQCEFIQLPPQINQNARLNADFVKRTADDPDKPAVQNPAYWRPTTEWENPIWGWIVTNYADYGIQFFLPDGTFYREVRFGGPTGALAEPKWLPFAPDQPTEAAETAQLDALIARLTEPDYLKGFWYMINAAMDNLPPAPNAYAQYLNSVVGKPLALVNMGWSLELDGPQLQNKSTNAIVRNAEQSLLLPGPDDPPSNVYTFQVKPGDKEREYDGLVGYFDVLNGHPPIGQELNLDQIKTYFAPETTMTPLKPMTTDEYFKFTAYWVPPFPETAPFDQPIAPDVYTDLRNKKLQIYGAIVDPFTPIHGYSSFLPAKSLQLQSWTWQEAMNRMTAFFHTGPLTLSGDVLAYDPDRQLTTKSMNDMPPNNISIPALGAGDWNWLQPYVDPEAGETLTNPPVFNSYGIEKKGDILKPGFQKGPYTAIEGFLQLRNPIMAETPPKSNTVPA